jgi:phosphoglycolate phosphatase-like HAD superfamily hydrolase
MKHIVWDWNGTLIDDLEAVILAVNAVMREFDGPDVTAEEYRAHYRRPVRHFYSHLLGCEVDDDSWMRIDVIFHEHYEAHTQRAPLAHGAHEVLASIAERRWTQSLLSMWHHDLLVPEIERRGIRDWFQRVDGGRLGEGGSKGQALVRHLASLDLQPAEVALIGDTEDDAHAAQAVGAQVVLVTGTQHPERLHATGAPVVGTLSDAVSVLA